MKLQFYNFFPLSKRNHSGDNLDFWHILQEVDI